jgi:hypothetical protein
MTTVYESPSLVALGPMHDVVQPVKQEGSWDEHTLSSHWAESVLDID